MRITVYDVLGYLASGMTDEELLADFSGLTREDIDACRAFAADTEQRVGEIGAKATSRNDRAALASALQGRGRRFLQKGKSPVDSLVEERAREAAL